MHQYGLPQSPPVQRRLGRLGGLGFAAGLTASGETDTGIVYNKYVSVVDRSGSGQPIDFDALL